MIFTKAEGGYRWAPMNLTGPLSAPQNDLAQRIERAVPNAKCWAAEDVFKEVPKVPDAPKKALDGLLNKLPQVRTAAASSREAGQIVRRNFFKSARLGLLACLT